MSDDSMFSHGAAVAATLFTDKSLRRLRRAVISDLSSRSAVLKSREIFTRSLSRKMAAIKCSFFPNPPRFPTRDLVISHIHDVARVMDCCSDICLLGGKDPPVERQPPPQLSVIVSVLECFLM